MRWLRNGAVLAGAAAAYASFEARAYRVVTRDAPVEANVPELTVLHVSDFHLRASQRRLIRFLERLPDRVPTPDLVIATGDLIEDDGGIPPVVEIMGRLEARLGRFYVLGSHDLYHSSIRGVLGAWRMFVGLERTKKTARRNDHEALERGLQEKGWRSLINRTEVVGAPWGPIRLCGTHDPYLDLHRVDHIRRSRDDAVAIGVVHAPDIVSDFALRGFDLVLAGHTHAGQVRLPGVGSIVTNSSIPNALSGGLHRVGGTWLHVSPGLGTGRFTPIRLGAPPEVTLLRLLPRAALFA
jgi:uncharacterized protein